MTMLLKLAFAAAMIAVLAYGRIAYVRHILVINKESVVGEALDPINLVSVFAMYVCAALAILFLASAAFVAIARRFADYKNESA
jgi:hypothetical protein